MHKNNISLHKHDDKINHNIRNPLVNNQFALTLFLKKKSLIRIYAAIKKSNQGVAHL